MPDTGSRRTRGGDRFRDRARDATATRSWPGRVLLTIIVLATTGCAGLDHRALDAGLAEAATAGLVRQEIDTGRLTLASWHRGLAGARLIAVYIEGDGQAWITRRRLSDDPTPSDPVALRLAARDPSHAVLYLARPCQFGTAEHDPACDPHLWSSHRYGTEVLDSLHAGLAWAAQQTGDKDAVRFGLVGYSGGGVLAALLAEQRDDIAWLVTVAANLDPEAWTLHHELSPLVGSLDPVAQAGRLRGLPQMHLAGSDDRVVPAYTRGRFLVAAGAEQRVVDGATHGCCWVDSWPRPLCRFLADAAVAGATAGDASTTDCR